MTTAIRCEDVAGNPDYRRLSDIDGIRVELRYATSDNFVGHDLYTPLDCAWLHREAADALQYSAAWLAAEHPGLRLLVLDAMRPQRVQEELWASLQGTNLLEYLADPARGSIHSFGMAVDVTLVAASGRELDMGTPFDDMSERSHPVLEDALVARGVLLPASIGNRRLLRAAMHAGGWRGINSEWWHFDCGDRERVRAQYTRIL
ncbi:MAG: M15 family metallopeptidase [Betaproteobacteria bacterium]